MSRRSFFKDAGFIAGGAQGCMAAHPSDTAPALAARDARILTSSGRSIHAEGFWEVAMQKATVLEDNEIVTEIQVPLPGDGIRSAFVKFALRKSIDFPAVNCPAAVDGGRARMCLNAVYNMPYRATKAEELIAGQTINKTNAEAAGAVALEGSMPLSMNRWKVQLTRVLVKEALLACA